MRSKVAGEVREAQERDLAAMTPDERMQLALRLGDDDVAIYAATQNLDRDEAMRRLQRERNQGRRPSGCMDALNRS